MDEEEYGVSFGGRIGQPDAVGGEVIVILGEDGGVLGQVAIAGGVLIQHSSN